MSIQTPTDAEAKIARLEAEIKHLEHELNEAQMAVGVHPSKPLASGELAELITEAIARDEKIMRPHGSIESMHPCPTLQFKTLDGSTQTVRVPGPQMFEMMQKNGAWIRFSGKTLESIPNLKPAWPWIRHMMSGAKEDARAREVILYLRDTCEDAFNAAEHYLKSGQTPAEKNIEEFGTNPQDSDRLLRLRELIEKRCAWPSEKHYDDGDYESAVMHTANLVRFWGALAEELFRELDSLGNVTRGPLFEKFMFTLDEVGYLPNKKEAEHCRKVREEWGSKGS